jgi:hypothetical protein
MSNSPCADSDTVPERRQIIPRQKEIIENHIKEYEDLLKVVHQKLQRYDELAGTAPAGPRQHGGNDPKKP